MREITYVEAINETLHQMIENYVLCYGPDSKSRCKQVLCLLAGGGAVKGEYKKITGVVIRREMRIDCR